MKIIKYITRVTSVFVLSVVLLGGFVSVSLAQSNTDLFSLMKAGGLEEIGKNAYLMSNPGNPKSVPDIVASGISLALTLLGMLFLILVLWGGFLWMTARGNEDQTEKARDIILNGTIGLAIILSAYSITLFIADYLTQATG